MPAVVQRKTVHLLMELFGGALEFDGDAYFRFQRMRTQFITSIVSLMVLVALCFSIGEGLRLTPFPVSALTIEQAWAHQSAVKAALEVSLYKYGPLDVPPQNQKRNKRNILEFICAPSAIVPKSPTFLFGSCDQQGPHVNSALCVSRVAGRDPPSLS